MTEERLEELTGAFSRIRLGIVGDFCLDRYLEIDPSKQEVSIETGLPVHNVVHVRAQPGGAGTILNNLVSLGIGEIFATGFHGADGEGFELRRSLAAKQGVRLDYFAECETRRTFTYVKPLVMEPGRPPRELNRLDLKNWTRTPSALEERTVRALEGLAERVDGIIVLEQVDLPQTGVITDRVLEAVRQLQRRRPDLLIVADGRRGLRDFPPVTFKMNRAELVRLAGQPENRDLRGVAAQVEQWAARQGQRIFVTLAEQGILGTGPGDGVHHVPALPVRGPIDIVGAGDSVTAGLAAALAAGGSIREAMELAMLVSSIVVHQLGTTGSASVDEIRELFQQTEKERR